MVKSFLTAMGKNFIFIFIYSSFWALSFIIETNMIFKWSLNWYKVLIERIRQLLHEEYSFYYDQIQLETDFEKELGTNFRKMLELINDFEKIFDIEITFNDIDDFIYSGQTIKIQDVVDYIEKKINDKK